MSPQPSVFLSYIDRELVVNFGTNPLPKSRSPSRILVVGGGVTGLTTAWALLDAGYSVTVISERWANPVNRITSQIAGALWEWPPAVCGKHTNIISLTNSKRWCMTSYRAFSRLMKFLPAEDHGVRMRMANFFFKEQIERLPGQLEKMVEIQEASDIQGFLRDPDLVKQHAVNQKAGVKDSYRHLAPVIDTDHYMVWLRALVASEGGHLITRKITGDLLEQEDRLLAEYNAVAIVNATGLNSYETAGDKTAWPLRGALIRVINDGKKFPKVEEVLCVSHLDTHGEDEDIVFIVPRNDRTLILGGLAQPNVHTLDLKLDSPEIIRMRERCNNFVPGLDQAELDAVPLVQGLRPFRDTNVRVEREKRLKARRARSRIIHSYGQGGAGFSLSFGCASDVLNLMREVEAETETNLALRSHL
ncbi:hypothetical protein AX16_010033 [Volvariella volvacea WC 439]|nr:hypothetical protein AX16_010033 [Volvariella volvacea WC 439]